MIYIAICDDEAYYREYINKLVLAYKDSSGLECVIQTFESGKALIDLGEEIKKYHIIFLDINMDGLDGMMTAKRIHEFVQEVFVVFVTAHVSYATEGYKVDAFRYLLKDNEGLDASIKECLDAVMLKINREKIKQKFEFIEGTKEIPIDKVAYIESRLHKLEFYIMENGLKKYSMYKKLDEAEEMLKDYGFIRIHQSYLTNIKCIKAISGYKAILFDEMEFSIPKKRYKAVKDAFILYKGEL